MLIKTLSTGTNIKSSENISTVLVPVYFQYGYIGLHFLLAEMHEHQTLKTRQQEDLLQ